MPSAAWQFALRRCDAFELMQVAEAAEKYGSPESAELAWRQAMRVPEPLVASFAGFRLGGKLADRGDKAGAIAAYRASIAAGETAGAADPFAPATASKRPAASGEEGRWDVPAADSVMTAFACVNLGKLLADQGESAEAIAVYRKGVAFDDPVASALAAMNLAGLLHRQGDLPGARSAYEQVLSSTVLHGDSVGLRGMAAHELGSLLVQEGQTASALTALKLAVDTGHSAAAPRAAGLMASLLKAQGDQEGAAAAYRTAAGAKEPAVAAAARFGLAQMAERTDPKQAAAAYREVADAGVPQIAGMALLRLGRLLADGGERDGAERAYRQSMELEREDPASAAESAVLLGSLLEGKGDRAGARAAYIKGMESGQEELWPAGAYGLGNMLLDSYDFRGARAALQRAVDSGHRRIAPVSMIALGDALMNLGEVNEARSAFEGAARSGSQEAADLARERLDKWQRWMREHRPPGS